MSFFVSLKHFKTMGNRIIAVLIRVSSCSRQISKAAILLFLRRFVCILNAPKMVHFLCYIDETKLATIFGGMVTYFQMGDVVSRLLFSTLVIYLPSNYIAVVYMVLVLLAFLYTFKKVEITI